MKRHIPTWLGWKEGVVVLCFLVVLLLPLAFSGESLERYDASRQLVVMTPHNEQIRYEFGRAFKSWHQRTYGELVDVIWEVPGGTSEIRRMLQSQWNAALEQGRQPGGDADLVFGGGSYEHDVLKGGVDQTMMGLDREEAMAWLAGIGVEDPDVAIQDGQVQSDVIVATIEEDSEGLFTIHATASISARPPMDMETLPSVYGRTHVAGTPLWDPDEQWFGTAMSSFGLIGNSDELRARGIPPPNAWEDLADPRLQQAVSMVNPGQSGSVTTAFETILHRLGWDPGWRILRRAAANARTFSASSLRGPTDVAAGDAAMGVCIDFFGRYQQQALADQGVGDRLMYVDPPGQTTLDPDPISMLARAPDQELAARFIEFTLTEEGQALWQFPVEERADGMLGPHRFALRRLPVRGSMYTDHFEEFVDQVDPFANATEPAYQDRAMRSFIAPLMQAMAVDERTNLQLAWSAITSHPAYPVDTTGVVTASDVEDPQLKRMIEKFDAMPTVTDPDGVIWSLDTPEGRAVVKRGWLRGGWADADLWHPESSPTSAFRRHAGKFFRSTLTQVSSENEVP
ncbi:MAG: extracellular solute-binding protein [Phycisphaerales bacterium]|nr:extracellular solute-binding protein [Phycisphaerales bacterium]